MVSIKRLGANSTVLRLSNGGEILFSYETPVAAFIPGRGYVKTDKYYSRTTSKHITEWVDGGKAATVKDEEILKLTAEAS